MYFALSLFVLFLMNSIIISLQMGSEPVVIISGIEEAKEAFAKDAFSGRPNDNVLNSVQKLESEY